VSLQADFENLPERMQAALTELTSVEIESLRLLTHAYDDKADFEAVIPLLLSLKGALQYRRVMGEKFFQKTLKTIKEQFYAAIPKRQ
jgi:TetR/AcrR family transcriptional repressor of nem operon